MVSNLLNRWMITVCVLLGIWLLISPWVVSEASRAPSSWSFHASGALALLLGILALTRSDDLAEYGLIAIAVWMVISPWVLDLPTLVTKQAVFYGVILGSFAWFGRSSFEPRPVDN